MSEDLTQSELLFNDNVDDIVSDIRDTVDDPNISSLERAQKVSTLLKEMEEYTHPLIAQIDELSNAQKHLILCRIARVFPSIIQKEIKSIANWPRSKMIVPESTHEIEQQEPVEPTSIASEQKHAEDLSKILNRLGYRDVDELYRHSKPSQIFGQYVNRGLVKKESEKANSKKVDQQLKLWKRQKEQKGELKIQQLKERKKSQVKLKIPDVVSSAEDLDAATAKKNDVQKVMMMMGIGQCDEKDIHVICNAPSKALKLV